MRRSVPQKPVSSPTEKQLLSLLKAADRETGPAESSITWRVFILRRHMGGSNMMLVVAGRRLISWFVDQCGGRYGAYVKTVSVT